MLILRNIWSLSAKCAIIQSRREIGETKPGLLKGSASLTIKDIAADTHLSLSTVSKYFNNKKISEESHKKIEESIRRLGYVPNQAARSLRAQKALTISVLLPDIGDYFWGSFCNTFETALRTYGYSTMISGYDRGAGSENHLRDLQFLLSKQVAGVIFFPCSSTAPVFLADLKKCGIPVICIDQLPSNSKSDFIASENRAGTREATEYLLSCGHRNIHVLCGDTGSYSIRERIAGYRSALADAHLPFQPEKIHGGDFSIQTGFDQFKKLMLLKERPTAVLSLGHDIAIGALTAANELNVRLPDDLSFLTFDDDEIFNSTDPPITSVVQNFDEMGKRAAELIVRRVKGDYSRFPQTQLIKTTLIRRASVRDLNRRP